MPVIPFVHNLWLHRRSKVHSNITTQCYSIAQQETVQGKSWRVNHVNIFRQESWQNPEEGSAIQSNQNVHVVGERTLKITSLKTDHPSGLSQSAASTNLKISSSVRRTNLWILKTESPRHWSNRETVSVRTSRLKRKICICTHKPLNAQQTYFAL